MIILCPHCNLYIEIEKLNCGIFRHGQYFEYVDGNIKLLGQINPHESESVCNMLVSQNKIIGCGNTFKIVVDDDKSKSCLISICDYV